MPDALGRWPVRRNDEQPEDPLLNEQLTTTCSVCGHIETGPARDAIAAMREHRKRKHPELPEVSRKRPRRRTKTD